MPGADVRWVRGGCRIHAAACDRWTCEFGPRRRQFAFTLLPRVTKSGASPRRRGSLRKATGDGMSAVRTGEGEGARQPTAPWPSSSACPSTSRSRLSPTWLASSPAVSRSAAGKPRTPRSPRRLALFSALMCAAPAVSRPAAGSGRPPAYGGTCAASWLPVALLLPPLYALAAPSALGLLSYLSQTGRGCTGGYSAARRSACPARLPRRCSAGSCRRQGRARPRPG